MNAIIALFAVAVVSAVVPSQGVPTDPPDDAGWSKTTRDIRARITLVERPAYSGTRSLVPYFELSNVGSSAYPVKVRCGPGHF